MSAGSLSFIDGEWVDTRSAIKRPAAPTGQNHAAPSVPAVSMPRPDRSAETIAALQSEVASLRASLGAKDAEHAVGIEQIRAEAREYRDRLRRETDAVLADQRQAAQATIDAYEERIKALAADYAEQADAWSAALDSAKADADRLRAERQARTDRNVAIVRRCALPVILGGQVLSWVGTVLVARRVDAVSSELAWLLPSIVEGSALVALAALVLNVLKTRQERRFGLTVLLLAAAIAIVANYAHAGPSALAKILGLAPTVLSTLLLKVVIPKPSTTDAG